MTVKRFRRCAMSEVRRWDCGSSEVTDVATSWSRVSFLMPLIRSEANGFAAVSARLRRLTVSLTVTLSSDGVARDAATKYPRTAHHLVRRLPEHDVEGRLPAPQSAGFRRHCLRENRVGDLERRQRVPHPPRPEPGGPLRHAHSACAVPAFRAPGREFRTRCSLCG